MSMLGENDSCDLRDFFAEERFDHLIIRQSGKWAVCTSPCNLEREHSGLEPGDFDITAMRLYVWPYACNDRVYALFQRKRRNDGCRTFDCLLFHTNILTRFLKLLYNIPATMNFREFYHLLLPQTHLNKSLRILITLNTAMTFVIGLFAPFYAIFVVKIGGDIAFAGFSWAVLQIVAGVLTLYFTRWSLRVREQELLISFGYILRAVVFLSYAFMGSMGQLIFTQVLWGIAAAISTPAFDSVYAAHTTKDGSIVEWGGFEGVTSIAVGVAALLGGLVIKSFGFVPIFIAMSAVAFLLAVYIWRLPREVL